MLKTDFKQVVKEFFKNEFWVPKQGDYIDKEAVTCCPAGAALIASGFDYNSPPFEANCKSVAKELGLSSLFILGVANGFDDATYGAEFAIDYKEGFQIGQELRSELLFYGEYR